MLKVYITPVMHYDPSGHFFFSTLLIGALVGGIISSGISIGTQAIFSGGNINWGQVLLDGAIGAIGGLVAATGIGTIGAALFLQY